MINKLTSTNGKNLIIIAIIMTLFIILSLLFVSNIDINDSDSWMVIIVSTKLKILLP